MLQTHRSKDAWKADFKEASKAGKYRNHRQSRILYEAKTDLFPYGEWTHFWEGDDCDFAVRKADKLVFVGKGLTSQLPLDRAEVCLPTALNTLYALAHLDRDILLLLIE